MALNITLPLFGNPGAAVREEAEAGGQEEWQPGRELAEHLDGIIDMLLTLQAAGWDVRTVRLRHPSLQTKEELRTHLAELGFDPEAVFIHGASEDEDTADESRPE